MDKAQPFFDHHQKRNCTLRCLGIGPLFLMSHSVGVDDGGGPSGGGKGCGGGDGG